MSEQQGERAAVVRAPMTALDFVQMYLYQTENHPQNGHYVNAVACRRKSPAGAKDDRRSRCARCDAEALMTTTTNAKGAS